MTPELMKVSSSGKNRRLLWKLFIKIVDWWDFIHNIYVRINLSVYSRQNFYLSSFHYD
jgi:hypothetical protein